MARNFDELSIDEQIAFIEAETSRDAARILGVDNPNGHQLASIRVLQRSNAARLPRLRENKRQQDIEGAVGKIERTFGKYDEPYYEKVKSDYLGYATPQVQDQYEQARRQLTFNLARGPGAASSVGAKAIGGLQSTLQKARADIGQKASDVVRRTRSNVSALKGSLIDQAYGGEGLEQLGQIASEQVANASAIPGYSPIGDIFGIISNQNQRRNSRTM